MERRSCSARSYLFLLAAGAVLIASLPCPAAAQSPWMARDGNQTLMLEFLGPSIEDIDQELFSGAFFLGGRGAVGSRIFVVGELPFVRHESTDEFFSSEISSSTIGNPYVGLEMNLASGPAFIELGVRPPLAADDEFPAVTTGIVADVTQWEAFFPEVFSIVGAFNVREVTPSKLAYRLRVGPAVMIPTNDGSDETVVFAVY
ncbi:MAG TPA: hypothetical protein VJW75_01475, partial [Candidatus Eisenbacteria bacterium]|nr:hypothetical protein [Candidatus Eisenbacteria bacterium]